MVGFCQGRAPAVFCPHRRAQHTASLKATLEADIAFVLGLVAEATEPSAEDKSPTAPLSDEGQETD